jgi:hypothetical protein
MEVAPNKDRESILYKLFCDDVLIMLLEYEFEPEFIKDLMYCLKGQWEMIRSPQRLACRVGSIELARATPRNDVFLPLEGNYSLLDDNSNLLIDPGVGVTPYMDAGHCYSSDTPALELVKMAVKNEHIELVEYFLSTYFKRTKAGVPEGVCMDNNSIDIPGKLFLPILEIAAGTGNLEITQLILGYTHGYNRHVIKEAARLGMKGKPVIELLKNYHRGPVFYWYTEHIDEGRSTHIMKEVAASGSLELLEWIYPERIMKQNTKWIEGQNNMSMGGGVNGYYNIKNFDILIENAASNGHEKMVKKLCSIHPTYPESDYVLECALKNDHVDLFYWLYNRQTSECNSQNFLLEAARIGNLQLYIWLKDPNTGKGTVNINAGWSHPYTHLFDVIYKNYDGSKDHFAILCYICETENANPSSNIIENVCRYGLMDVVKYFMSKFNNNCEYRRMFKVASEKGFYDLSKLLLKYIEFDEPKDLIMAMIRGSDWDSLLEFHKREKDVEKKNHIDNHVLNEFRNVICFNQCHKGQRDLVWFSHNVDSEIYLPEFYEIIKDIQSCIRKPTALKRYEPNLPVRKQYIPQLEFRFGTEISGTNLEGHTGDVSMLLPSPPPLLVGGFSA